MRNPLVVGNWKMNGTVGESLSLLTGIERQFKTAPAMEVVLCPPFTSLYSATIALQDAFLLVGAQNCHWEDSGAFTGEISPTFLADMGVAYVILGHSERRKYCGETSKAVNLRVINALRSELVPIMCVGETAEERAAGKTTDVITKQLKEGFADLHVSEAGTLVVAYEPIWAIGTGDTATTEQVAEAHSTIRKYLARIFDAPTAHNIRIMYGGSVNKDNAEDLAALENVDGALVGGASLDTNEFAAIIRAFERNIK